MTDDTPTRYELTLAHPDDDRATEGKGSDGQGDVLKALSKHPLAQAEINAATKVLRRHRTSVDHIHLARYNGTDLVQWLGRFSSGYHYPLGRLMKMVPLAKDTADAD